MESLAWYLFTFGIPLFGLAACLVGAAVGYRRVKNGQWHPALAVIGYLGITLLLPIALAWLALGYGHTRAKDYADYSLSGEHMWALLIFMEIYLGVAALGNAAFWIALGVLISKRRKQV